MSRQVPAPPWLLFGVVVSLLWTLPNNVGQWWSAMRDIVGVMLAINAHAYSFEAANVRHEHEWKVWQEVKLPDDKLMLPGIVSHATNVVEHPELVAERIVRYAQLIGLENVLAGTACGFAQGPFHRRVHPSIMWAKLEALSAGAKLASRELWG